MSLSAFIDLSIEDQADELINFFRDVGAADLPDSKLTPEEALSKIVAVCDFCFQEGNENDAEAVLNSIISMLVLLPAENAEKIITTFVDKLVKFPNNKLGLISLRVLSVLFHGLDSASPFRYPVYFALVQVAGKVDQIRAVYTDLEKTRTLLAGSKPSSEQMQKLLRVLHEALLNCRESDLASKVMVELLSTYTTENASQAREEAQRCIVASLADPNTLLLDHLLTLQPVKVLEGAVLHDLLTIFVSENFSAYLKFYADHKDFIDGLGLKHEENIRKMRLLTFMQMAENASEIPFDVLQQQLNLEEADVEEFVIEVMKTKLVRARMDQFNKKVSISSTMHRTFGKQQWQQLRDLLTTWRSNLRQVKDSMQAIVNEQAELLMQQA